MQSKSSSNSASRRGDEESGKDNRSQTEKNTSDINIHTPYYVMKKIFKKSVKKDGTEQAENEEDADDKSQASEDIEKMIEDPFQNVAISQIKMELRDRVYMMIKHHIHDK